MHLARSEQSENQAFRYGERTWGLQFHPEVDLPLYLGWIKNWAGAPERMGLDPDALEASIAAGSPRLHRAALRSVLLGLRRRGELTASAARIPLAPVAGWAPRAVRAAVYTVTPGKGRQSDEGDEDEDEVDHVQLLD